MAGVIGYLIAHWQSFRRNTFRGLGELDAEGLVFDTLQVAILIAMIFAAGATLPAVAMLGEHLLNRGAIIVLVILAILFYLLHHVVRSFRVGWQPRRRPPKTSPGARGCWRPPRLCWRGR